MTNDKFIWGRCSGVESTGRRCTHMAASERGLCRRHESPSPDASTAAAGPVAIDLQRCLHQLQPHLESAGAGQPVRIEATVHHRDQEPSRLAISVYGKRPGVIYNQWLELTPTGRLLEPAADDGFTSLGAPTIVLQTGVTDDEAASAVAAWLHAAVRRYRDHAGLDRPTPPRREPVEQPAVARADLADACRWWQSGRDGGSSLLRGAARALTGKKHYFSAGFITAYEDAARSDPAALEAAAVLLRGIYTAVPKEADAWNAATGLPARGFAGRGLVPNLEKDSQIEAAIRKGRLVMPLWGVSLDPAVASSYGTRWLLMIDGEFPGVAAWVHSDEKPEEQELIAGGEYHVASVRQDGDTTVVRLAYAGPVGDRVGTDPLLTTIMGRLPEVLVSRLVRDDTVGLTPVVERLDLELTGDRKLSIGRTQDDHAVAAVAFDPPAAWAEAGDDDYATWANWERIKKRVELPADADAIIDWVLRETVRR